jgi:hypothetical protein
MKCSETASVQRCVLLVAQARAHVDKVCRYEEQSVKVASLQSMNRDMQVQLLRTGGTADSVSLASMSQPQGRTPTLGRCMTPPMNRESLGTVAADAHAKVTRELDFGAECPEAMTPDMFPSAGQENDAAAAAKLPKLGTS